VTDSPLVILDIIARGLRAKVLWNGIVLLDGSPKVQVARSSKINGWTVNGPNTLIVQLAALPEPDIATPPVEDEPASPVFEVRLRKTFAGALDEADETLVDYEWTAEQPLAPVLAGVLERAIPMTAPAVWSWQEGYRFTSLGAGDVNDIIHHLGQLHAALERRDIDTVIALQHTQLSEQALALSRSVEDVFASYGAFLTDLMGGAGWTAQFFPPARIGLESMADGRILHVSGPDGGPPIRTASSTGRFAIDPYMSRVGGVWTIVR
jgi:hypothetical protein